jgi:hypothetical protein
MTTENNRPAETLYDGSMKATIWENTNEKGTFFTTRFTRCYRDEQGKWHETDTFSGTQLLRLVRLANLAYECSNALRSLKRKPLPQAD